MTPPFSPLVTRFREVAARHRRSRAVSGQASTLTYGELADRAEAWAGDLRGFGLPVGSVVALLASDPAFLAAGHLAARSAGLVPLLVDPALPAERRSALVSAARSALTMTVRQDPSYEPCHQAAYTSTATLPSEAGYLTFTSGTQGNAKGIIGYEQGLVHFADWEISTLGLRPGTRVAQLTPPSFDVVFRDLFTTLLGGGELIVAPPSVRADPSAVVLWLADQRAEILHAVPSLATRWLEYASERRMPDLRWTLFAGEPLHASQVRAWRAAATASEVINLYGPSETTLAKFWYHVPAKYDSDVGLDGVLPVGRPLPDTVLRPLRLADADGSFRVGIETPHGSLGYLPGTATADDDAALRRMSGVTTFLTQDQGRLDPAGNLVVVGRLDSRVKRRGVLVDLGEIEGSALRCTGVALACCVQTCPESGGRIVLAIESADPEAPAALRKHLRRTLGAQAPDDFVRLERIPLLPSGKIDRRAVRGLLEPERVRTVVIVDPYSSGALYAPALRRAGFSPVAVCSVPRPAPVFTSSLRPDDFDLVLTADGDQTLLVQRLAALAPLAVLPGSESGVVLADHLAGRLTPHLANASDSAGSRRHKGLMIQALREHGLPVAPTLCVRSADESAHWIEQAEAAGHDLVIKPAMSLATDGVTLARGPQGRREAVAGLLGRTNPAGVRDDEVVIQRRLVGTEYAVNTFSHDGRHTVTDICRYAKLGGAEQFAVYKDIEFIGGEEPGHTAMIEYVRRALDAVGFRFGPAHTEVMLTADGPRLVEVNSRVAGSGMAAAATLATGDNGVERTVRYLRGERDFADTFTLRRTVMVAMFIARRGGVVSNIRALDRIRDLPTCRNLVIRVEDGDEIPATSDLLSSVRLGWALLAHQDAARVRRDHARVRAIAEHIRVTPSAPGRAGVLVET